MKKKYPQGQALECIIGNYFSYLSTQTYVVDTQKYLLGDTILLSTGDKCLEKRNEIILQFHNLHPNFLHI